MYELVLFQYPGLFGLLSLLYKGVLSVNHELISDKGVTFFRGIAVIYFSDLSRACNHSLKAPAELILLLLSWTRREVLELDAIATRWTLG